MIPVTPGFRKNRSNPFISAASLFVIWSVALDEVFIVEDPCALFVVNVKRIPVAVVLCCVGTFEFEALRKRENTLLLC